MSVQQTFVMIKPEGVERRLVGQIIHRFERKNLKLISIKSLVPSKQLVREHYEHLKDKPFFDELVDQLSASLVVCMIWEGLNAIESSRRIIGLTNPLEAAIGSIRGDLAEDITVNVVHGSDSEVSCKKEIALWFSDKK